MTDSALQAALNFTDDDLVANRAGRLSPAQQTRMTKLQGQGQIGNIVFVIVFVVILVAIAAFVLPPLFAPQPANSSAVPPGIIVLVVVVVLGIIGLSFLRTRRRLRGVSGAVLTVEGEAKPSIRAAGNVDQLGVGIMFRVKVGSVTFAVQRPDQVSAFQDGADYKAYYVKGTLPILVSAELADERVGGSAA
ncbi:MAG TPA: hypothetical protein VGM70_01460 [Pseudolysinimonas sp.]